MNTNQVKGAIKDVAGKAQEKIGNAIDSDKQRAKGLSKQVEGKVQKKVGDVQEAFKDLTK